MSRLIDADALVRDHGFFIEDEDGFPTCVVCETDIRYYPTIDAVPVVRCKDCKHRFKDSWCEYADDDNFYCARGKRKEGAD